MSNRESQWIRRREFLVGSSIPFLSPFVSDILAVVPTLSSAAQEKALEATETISVGYWKGSSHPEKAALLGSGEKIERAQPQEINTSEPAIALKITRERVSALEAARLAGFQPDVERAEAVDPDLEFERRGARIRIHGVYTAAHQWTDNDLGTFSMRVEFKPIEACCQTISSYTVGSIFAARKNNIVPSLSQGLTVAKKVPVDFSDGLRFSFDLVDIPDDQDKSFVRRMLNSVQTLPLLKQALAVGEIEPSINLASLTLELLGRNYLTSTPSAKAIWQQHVPIEFTLGDDPLLPKIRKGVYFFAGRSRSTNTAPSWNQYQLMGCDKDNSGDRRCLKRLDENRNPPQFVPADFHYVIVHIDYAT